MTPDQFKARRIALGYSQTQLAKALGISVRTVSRIEAEGAKVSKLMALALRGLKEKEPKP